MWERQRERSKQRWRADDEAPSMKMPYPYRCQLFRCVCGTGCVRVCVCVCNHSHAVMSSLHEQIWKDDDGNDDDDNDDDNMMIITTISANLSLDSLWRSGLSYGSGTFALVYWYTPMNHHQICFDFLVLLEKTNDYVLLTMSKQFQQLKTKFPKNHIAAFLSLALMKKPDILQNMWKKSHRSTCGFQTLTMINGHDVATWF